MYDDLERVTVEDYPQITPINTDSLIDNNMDQTNQSPAPDYADIMMQAASLGLGNLGYLAGFVPQESPSAGLFDQAAKFLSEVKPNEWAKLAGGVLGGVGQAYLLGKKLDIEGQNAETQRQNADTLRQKQELEKLKDERAAGSAAGLNWNGLINKSMVTPIKPGQVLVPKGTS